MPLRDDTGPLRGFLTLATFVLAVAILRVAEDVLIPVAIAVLLAFLLAPVVVRLTRWGLPKTAAIIATVTLAFAVIAGVGWIVTTQVLDLARQLPNYEQNIHAKIARIKAPRAPDALSRATGVVENVRRQLQADEEKPPPNAATVPADAAPVPVVVQDNSSSLDTARDILGPVLGPLGTAGIVIVFVVAMLFQREDLRDRFLNLVSAGKLNTATQAVDDAAQRVSRYLAMQLVVNATYGIPVGLGLYFIGIPNALLWGLLATLLRFIPFLGPWIAASFPVVLALAVDPGWAKLFYVLGLFIVMELVSNNIIEVWLYGASTGISNVALLVAAVFWTWLWGTAGLFLSTPMTVCLMVLGKYGPGLKFLRVLLGSEPVLEPAAQLYQRMLAMDSDEVIDLAQTYVAERTLLEFYDDVFLPALLLAEQDRHHGSLAEVRQTFIFQASRELIEVLERNREKTDADVSATTVPATPSAPIILGVPARDDADEIVALMLRHLLLERGIAAEVSPITAKPEDYVRTLAARGISTVYVSALPPSALAAAQHVCRRIKQQCPGVHVYVGIWTRDAHPAALKERLRSARPDEVVTTLGEALVVLTRQAPSAAPAGEPTAAEPARHVAPLGLDDRAPEERFLLVTRDLAEAFGVPLSLVHLVDTDDRFWAEHAGLPADEARAATSTPVENSLCGFALGADDIFVVEDATKDKRLAAHPAVTERGVRFYAGVPLRTHNGHVVGTLCVVDTKPRTIDDALKDLLRARAEEFIHATVTHTPAAPRPPAQPPQS